MCSHPEHRVEVLPDGQIDEEHVLTEHEMRQLQAAVQRLSNRMLHAWYAMGTPGEVILNGESWTDPEGEFGKTQQA